MTATRPAADEIPALLEPIVRERIPGADTARIVNWRGTERGFSTETFLFDLDIDDVRRQAKHVEAAGLSSTARRSASFRTMTCCVRCW